jgi:hypothetical protein
MVLRYVGIKCESEAKSYPRAKCYFAYKKRRGRKWVNYYEVLDVEDMDTDFGGRFNFKELHTFFTTENFLNNNADTLHC